MAQSPCHRSLAQEQPPLSAQSCGWPPQEPGRSHSRRRADSDRGADRVHDWSDNGCAIGSDAVAATGAMFVIGRGLITVSENKNQAEAEYRYLLTRVRENGEGIALLKGEDEERSGVDKSFKSVLRTWRDVCIQSMRTTIVSQTSGYIAPILPIILCAPKFLDNAMTLGEVMQAASAFAIVQSALNWLVENYAHLADWAASARRVASLELALDALERAEIRRGVRIARGGGKDAALRLRDVSVTLDDGTAVVHRADVAI